MSETEIKSAIAAQEEYVKRIASCEVRFNSHRFAQTRVSHGAGGPVDASLCVRCGVSETWDDYRKVLGL